MLTSIRTFRHGGLHGEHRYRHAMDFDTDDVLLQRLNPEADTPDDEWTSLLRYDPHCNAWDAKTSERIGQFLTHKCADGIDRWVFVEDETEQTIACCKSSEVEGLLDSEVTISKRWLDSQPAQPKGDPGG